ncbi:MAG: LysR family transcriptional regulator [Myxococcales bacterium]|nr:LysR family transcriptional regulator [Myxococcales bacterium]
MHAVNLAGVDLNLLTALEALLAERSVTRAAARVGLSQPAASHALSRLRSLFGDPLLERVGPSMRLTARAEALAPRVSKALAAVREVLGPPGAFDPAHARGVLRLASSDFLQVMLLPALIERLAAEAPGIDLVIHPTVHLVNSGLAAGDFDFALAPVRGSMTDLGSEPLFSDHFVSVVREDHPLLKGRMTVERFAAARHAFTAPAGKSGGVVDRALAAHGTSRRVMLQAAQFLVTPFIVASSDLVITLPKRVAALFQQRLPLVTFAPPLELEPFTVSLIWHVRSERDPLQTYLRRTLIDVGKRAGALKSRASRERGPSKEPPNGGRRRRRSSTRT